MNSHAAAFSVLSTPVALCDRRALSEAWFAALHGHKDVPQTAPRHAAVRVTAGAGAKPAALPQRMQPQSAALLPQRTLRSGGAARTGVVEIADRRSGRGTLARDIVRTFARPAPPKHASFAIGAGQGRVQILLRSEGPFVQLIALCPPAARAAVAQALADARYALALRGIALGADVRGIARA